MSDQPPRTPSTPGSDLLTGLTTSLSTISLTELNASASLQHRLDRKYMIDGVQLNRMIGELAPDLCVLADGERRSFGYRTTYFDTAELRLYRLAATRRRTRHKVRIRHYVDAGDAMLEVKTKSGRGHTIKHRFEHTSLAMELSPGTRSLIRSVSPIPELVDHLQPVLTSAFHRTTLLDASSASRITVDADLICTAASGGTVHFDRYVLETKSVGSASATDRWLWRNGVRPSRISKYATSLAILDPTLPTNRWHRTITRHFSPRESDSMTESDSPR